MKKYAILFICHAINNESIFRYDQLKAAANILNYDLYWAIDNTKPYIIPEQLKDCRFYEFSYNDYSNRFPYICTGKQYCYGNPDWANATNGALMSFYLDNQNKYDYIWNIEYDVCIYGSWENFFKKYDQLTDVDFITHEIRNEKQIQEWNWYKIIPVELRQKMQLNIYASLNCLTRLSSKLLNCIDELFKQINNPCVFLEWIWATAAKNNGMEIQEFESNNFGLLNLTKFNDYKIDFPYHPIKFNINWKNILSKIPLDIK